MVAVGPVLMVILLTVGCVPRAPRIGGGGGVPVKAVPSSTVKFGSTVWANPGESMPSAVARESATYGQMDVLRGFASGLPKGWTSYTTSTGADLVASFKALPRDVIAGKSDAAVRAWFASAPSDRNVYWSYYHEPEDNIARGEFTAAEYRAAWNRLTVLARSVNPRLHSTLILMAWSLDPASGRNWRDYYAGDATIDVLGWDAYNLLANKGRYDTPDHIFGKSIAVSKSVGKPYGFAEFGSILAAGDSTGSGRAAWLRSAGSYLRSSGSLWAAYFNAPIGGEFRLLDGPSASAWRAIMAG
jgi:hypothetical protein